MKKKISNLDVSGMKKNPVEALVVKKIYNL